MHIHVHYLYLSYGTFTALILTNCGFEKAHNCAKLLPQNGTLVPISSIVISAVYIIMMSSQHQVMLSNWHDFWPLTIEIQVQLSSPLLSPESRPQSSPESRVSRFVGPSYWVIFTAKPTHGYVVFTLWVYQSTSPYS